MKRAPAASAYQLLFERVHVAIGEAVAARLAQPHAVDDRSVVERIGNDRVVFAQQRLEHAAIGVETGGEQDRVVFAEMRGDGALEVAMDRLRAADEAHRGHAEAEFVERAFGRGDDFGMIGEAKIIVGAEIDRRRAYCGRRRCECADPAFGGPAISRSRFISPEASISLKVERR